MLYFGMSFGVCVHRIVTRKSCKDDAGEATPAAIEERDSPVVSGILSDHLFFENIV